LRLDSTGFLQIIRRTIEPSKAMMEKSRPVEAAREARGID
jgi:hypothetical protein